MRINAYLSSCGVASRRACDAIVASGRVAINGRPARLGDQVAPNDVVTVDSRRVTPRQSVTIKMYKPRGVPVTRDDCHAPVTVMDFLPPSLQHLKPVGRLDALSEGLLLLTNDGQLHQKTLHPKYGHDKEYRVLWVARDKPSLAEIRMRLERLAAGRGHSPPKSKPLRQRLIAYDQSLGCGSSTVTLTEGAKRQIRSLFNSCRLEVTALVRTRIGSVVLDHLKPGHYTAV